MNGAAHYREGEWLLAQVTVPSSMSPDHRVLAPAEFPGDGHAEVIALAQAHFTAAVAAAIVDGPAVMRPEERDEWDRATGRLEATS